MLVLGLLDQRRKKEKGKEERKRDEGRNTKVENPVGKKSNNISPLRVGAERLYRLEGLNTCGHNTVSKGPIPMVVGATDHR